MEWRGGRRFQSAFRDLVEQGLVAHLQDAGGFRAIPSNTLEHFRESLALILDSGKPMLVTQSADPVGDRQVMVEVKATILK